MESILSTEKGVCFVCGRTCRTHLHHIFFGQKQRKISDREGLIVYLCPECHEGTDGVHGKNGSKLNFMLKEIAQEAWEDSYKATYPYKNHAEEAAREAFIRMMGKNYL